MGWQTRCKDQLTDGFDAWKHWHNFHVDNLKTTDTKSSGQSKII